MKTVNIQVNETVAKSVLPLLSLVSNVRARETSDAPRAARIISFFRSKASTTRPTRVSRMILGKEIALMRMPTAVAEPVLSQVPQVTVASTAIIDAAIATLASQSMEKSFVLNSCRYPLGLGSGFKVHHAFYLLLQPGTTYPQDCLSTLER